MIGVTKTYTINLPLPDMSAVDIVAARGLDGKETMYLRMDLIDGLINAEKKMRNMVMEVNGNEEKGSDKE